MTEAVKNLNIFGSRLKTKVVEESEVYRLATLQKEKDGPSATATLVK
jgi:hypothetical protein